MTLEITCEHSGNVLIVHLSGRLIASAVEVFKTQIETEISALPDAPQVIFDLANMKHIDSSGLGVLVYFLQMIRQRSGVIRLAAIQPRPMIVFNITKVYKVFEIFDTLDEAKLAFETPEA